MAFRIRLFLLLSIVIIAAACGGLGGEPRIVSTIPPATPFPADFSYRASLTNGARIYAENCTRCHGIGGAGDGELALSGDVQNVPDFTDSQARADESPQDYFNVITNGRIANLMPPWGESLSQEARWDVAFYTYALAYTREQLTRGDNLASNVTGAWSSIVNGEVTGLPQRSDNEVVALFTEADASQAASYSSADLLALAASTRLRPLSGREVIGQVAQQATPAPIATEEVIAATPITSSRNTGAPGTVTGRVTNGTATGTVPPETIVTLHVVSPDFTTETTANAPIAADGTFTFSGVSILDGANFFVSVPYRERLFASETVQADATTTSLDLPVTVYELTDDTSVISIIGMVTQIDASAAGDGLEFLQVIRFRNTSDRMFTTSFGTGTGFASVVMQLPPGSVVLGFQNEDRYIYLQEQSTVVDTLPVLPNTEHLMQLFYFVPYSSGAIIEQQVNYGLNGYVGVLLGSNTLSVESTQLAPRGMESVGDRQFNSFGGTVNLPAGDVVRYTLRGQISPANASVTSNNIIPLLMLAGGSVLLLFVIVMALRQRYAPRTAAAPAAPAPAPAATPDQSKLIDGLVRQIAKLDEQHEKGQINHDLYHQRRTKLKARLTELMDGK